MKELSESNSKSDVNFAESIKKDNDKNKNILANCKSQKLKSFKNDSYEKIIIESIHKKNEAFTKNRNF